MMRDLADGESVEMQGSGARPYILKNVGGVYGCSCPAWRNQGGVGVVRTCKHLKLLRGEAAERERIAGTVVIPKSASVVEAEAAKGRALRPDEKASLNGPPVLLAHDWWKVPDCDPTGWWMSEKLDGVRAYWDGKQFLSRQGNEFKAPAWFTESLPSHPLDGELWMGRGMFQKTISIVRRQDRSDAWKDVMFVVFDMPHLADVPFEARQTALATAVQGPYCKMHVQKECNGEDAMLAVLAEVVKLGAEGLMLRAPGSLYVAARSTTLLKVKPFSDDEAIVVGHTPGKGQHKGKTGSLEVQMPNGKRFFLGTGLKEKDRVNPPPIGATVTYRYTELTDAGIPKCGSFVAVRDGY